MCQLGTCPSSVVCRSWLDVLKLKPKLVLSWGPSWPHVGGLGASWDTLRRSSGGLKAMLSHAKASSPPAQRAASEPVSKNRCAFGFNMFICLQIACMILLIAVPLDWFACLLFVFFSERFPSYVEQVQCGIGPMHFGKKWRQPLLGWEWVTSLGN